jgi:hypothetical protein
VHRLNRTPWPKDKAHIVVEVVKCSPPPRASRCCAAGGSSSKPSPRDYEQLTAVAETLIATLIRRWPMNMPFSNTL